MMRKTITIIIKMITIIYWRLSLCIENILPILKTHVFSKMEITDVTYKNPKLFFMLLKASRGFE